MEAGWPRVCIVLETAMERILAAADWAAVGQKLWRLTAAAAWDQQRLLTPKVTALLLRLRDCQVLLSDIRLSIGNGIDRALLLCQRAKESQPFLVMHACLRAA